MLEGLKSCESVSALNHRLYKEFIYFCFILDISNLSTYKNTDGSETVTGATPSRSAPKIKADKNSSDVQM